jgi:hypothetical protein
MIRTGAPFEYARRTPSVPTPIPTCAALEITACSVSPLPWVAKFSSTMPCFLKMPTCCPSTAAWLTQVSICPIATLSTSSARAGRAESTRTTRAALARPVFPKHIFHLSPWHLPRGSTRLRACSFRANEVAPGHRVRQPDSSRVFGTAEATGTPHALVDATIAGTPRSAASVPAPGFITPLDAIEKNVSMICWIETDLSGEYQRETQLHIPSIP